MPFWMTSLIWGFKMYSFLDSMVIEFLQEVNKLGKLKLKLKYTPFMTLSSAPELQITSSSSCLFAPQLEPPPLFSHHTTAVALLCPTRD